MNDDDGVPVLAAVVAVVFGIILATSKSNTFKLPARSKPIFLYTRNGRDRQTDSAQFSSLI